MFAEVFGKQAGDDEDRSIPACAEHVFVWFGEMHAQRSAGFDANPLSFTEIFAWSALADVRVRPWELELLLVIDRTWREVRAEQRDRK